LDTPLFVPVEDVPPAPLTLRISRRQLVIRLLCALGTGVLAAVAWRPLYLTWLPAVLGVSFSAQLGGLVRSATGTIHIGPDGLRVRRLGITGVGIT
jgi:hypothetical protein